MKNIQHVLVILWLTTSISNPVSGQQSLTPLQISKKNPYLITKDQRPFLWIGDTAWELIHRLNTAEIELYLSNRSEKGFNVIQTVILAELDGLNSPNAFGDLPLIDNDPTLLNDAYFQLVDEVIQRASEHGMYVALLPTWGDKWNKKWGVGPEIFNPSNAYIFGEILASRYLKSPNIVWVLGGDRTPENEAHRKIIEAMAKGIASVDTVHLIAYHPSGANLASRIFPKAEWLQVDMFQSGHSSEAKEYLYVMESKRAVVSRPVINGEARYEAIEDRFWENKNHGTLDAHDVRVSAYWSILAGAAGYTYGSNSTWQMYERDKTPILNASMDWNRAIELPGATQIGYLADFITSYPWHLLQNDQSLILSANPFDKEFQMASIVTNSDLIITYSPTSKSITLNTNRLSCDSISVSSFNPVNGTLSSIGRFSKTPDFKFDPKDYDFLEDYIIVIEPTK